MKAVIQRVSRAQVSVDGEVIGAIEHGMLILLGVMKGDGAREAERLAERIARMRFFPDDDGRMNLDVHQVGGGVLVISQVTLAADGKKGRRPSLDRAAEPAEAEALYRTFCRCLGELGLAPETGRFGALMEVELVNHGPVTFHFEEPPPGAARSSQVLA